MNVMTYGFLLALFLSLDHVYAVSPLYKNSVVPSQTTQYRIVDFWASWCRTCVSNIKNLESIASKTNRSKGRVMLQLVSVDDEMADARNIFSERVWSSASLLKPYLFYDQNGDKLERYKFSEVPALIIIDKQGRIVWRHEGRLEKRDFKMITELTGL